METNRVGWQDDPERPGIQRYWEGDGWSVDIAPRPKPEPVWKQARVIALGVLVAAAVVFTVVRLNAGPSDQECMTQRQQQITDELEAEVAIGGGTDRTIRYASAECVGRGF